MTVLRRVWNYSQIQERVRHRETVQIVPIDDPSLNGLISEEAESKAGGRD